MTAAAFKAVYAEWKVVKTRATVQVVFELPIEKADEAYQVLGGMPIAAHEIWCGIARLKSQTDTVTGTDKTKRSFDEMSPSQQAGMLCQDRSFRLFLAEKFDMPFPDPDEAASVVRHYCKVNSRSEITKDNVGWSEIVLAYRLWQRAAEVVPA